MTYKNHLVACIKVNGKVLREFGDTVTIPFGSEYSILLKNLNSVRVQARVSVDGTDATDGTWLIIEPNASMELERFIKGGNWDRGNKFKFIERTKEIEDHRGIEADDGLIRVEYKTEKIQPEVVVPRIKYDDYYIPRPLPYNPWYPPYRSPHRVMRSTRPRASASSAKWRASGQSVRSMNMARSAPSFSEGPVCDAGITVPGSESNQKFVQGAWFTTEDQSDVLILRLRGAVAGKAVKQPITVDRKSKCVTCGRTNKGAVSFCSGCGTALQII